MSISWGAQYPKLKTNLGLAVNRLKLLQKKKTEVNLKARKEIADFIAARKDDRGRIRVEHIIREDFLVEAYEILEMYCDLLLARFGVITQMKGIEDGIAEPIVSLIWAAPRVSDVPELQVIAIELARKYGKPFAESARSNQLEAPCRVSQKLLDKMSLNAPDKVLVEKYMIEIARYYCVEFLPDRNIMRDIDTQPILDLLDEFKRDDNKGPGHGGNGGGNMFDGGNLIGFNNTALKNDSDNSIYEIPYPAVPPSQNQMNMGYPQGQAYPRMDIPNVPIIPTAPSSNSFLDFPAPAAPPTNKMPKSPPVDPHIYDVPPTYDITPPKVEAPPPAFDFDSITFPTPPTNFGTASHDHNIPTPPPAKPDDGSDNFDDLMSRLDNLYKK